MKRCILSRPKPMPVGPLPLLLVRRDALLINHNDYLFIDCIRCGSHQKEAEKKLLSLQHAIVFIPLQF